MASNPFSTLGTNSFASLPANTYTSSKTPAPTASPTQAPMGTKAVSPTSTVTKPPTTLPKVQTVAKPASSGTYKGVNIVPGTDAEVAAQVAKINANQPATSNTPSYPGLVGAQIQSKDQAAAAPTATQNPLTYSGLLGGVASSAQNVNNQAAKINTTADLIGSQGQVTQQEQDVKNKLAAIPGLLGNTTAAIENNPSEYAFQMGREAVAGRNIEAMRQSLADQSTAYATTRQANAQAYTNQAAAQNNAGGLYSNAGSLYQGAATSAQPSVTAPGQAVFNPLTGTYTDASSGGNSPSTAPSGINQDAWNQYIQSYASGNIGAIPSSITGNANLAGQLQAAVQAKNPSYDYATATGAAGARNSNAGLAGTATPNAYNSIYQKSLDDYTNLQQNVQNVDQFGKLLTSNMTTGGINPTDVKYANQTLAQIRGQLSSSAQAQYDTTLAALRSKISGMLSVGGNETPTAITADAQKILDGSLPLSSLDNVLSRIQAEGNVLMGTQAAKVNAAKTGTLGGNSQQGGSTGAITWDSILSH